MFDIGWSELLVVGVVALVVVGPKELPGMLRTLGKALAGVRRMAGDFQSQFNEALREAELDELKKEVDALRSTAKGFIQGADITSVARNEIRSAIQGEGSTQAAIASGAVPPVETDVAAIATVSSSAPVLLDAPVDVPPEPVFSDLPEDVVGAPPATTLEPAPQKPENP